MKKNILKLKNKNIKSKKDKWWNEKSKKYKKKKENKDWKLKYYLIIIKINIFMNFN